MKENGAKFALSQLVRELNISFASQPCHQLNNLNTLAEIWSRSCKMRN